MDKHDDFIKICQFVKNIGHIYESGDFAFYLYGLIKMIKPKMVVELGTGYGATAFLAAQACKENGHGKVVTVDDGSQWPEKFSYDGFLAEKIKAFKLDKTLEWRKTAVDMLTLKELQDISEVNVIFNDINCHPEYFLSILSWLLPRVRKEAYFFIDRGATFWANYCIVELTLDKLNQGKIPASLYKFYEKPEELEALVRKFKFSVQYVKKAVKNDQDSFALVKIEEIDVRIA